MFTHHNLLVIYIVMFFCEIVSISMLKFQIKFIKFVINKLCSKQNQLIFEYSIDELVVNLLFEFIIKKGVCHEQNSASCAAPSVVIEMYICYVSS